MKRSRFSEAQVAFVPRQAEEGTKVEEVCRKAGISPATFYAWKIDQLSRHQFTSLAICLMAYAAAGSLRSYKAPGLVRITQAMRASFAASRRTTPSSRA